MLNMDIACQVWIVALDARPPESVEGPQGAAERGPGADNPHSGASRSFRGKVDVLYVQEVINPLIIFGSNYSSNLIHVT